MTSIRNECYKGSVLSSNKILSNKKYTNCEFDNCKITDYRITNCEFEDCLFRDCDFCKTFLAINKNYESGKFLNCVFITCNFSAASFRFPVIDGCEFRNCNLSETNFDGSRFSNTKFIGELDSCFFRGYSIYANSNSLFTFSKFDASQVYNEMINVDFSLSKMIGVSFTNGIDLGNCIFPKGDDYIYITDLKGTIDNLLQIINSNWANGYKKDTAIKLIELVYLNKDKQEQENDFIDSFIAKEMSDEDEGVSLELFNLIKSLQC